MIAIISIESKDEFKFSQRVYEFSKLFLKNLKKFIDVENFEEMDETITE
jgi:hypothetical protein